MSAPPSVAVCIPTYNQARYLVESISSACQQTYPGVEVWVSDDASTDDTPAVLASLSEQFPQLRHYRQPTNLNIAENTTWLLAQPKTDLIVRLDSDDIMEPRYCETLVPLMMANPTAGYAHSAIQIIDEDGHPISIARVARPTGLRDADRALREAVGGYRVAANIVMFRTHVLHEMNFYRGRPNFGEDYDLSIRIADAGFGNIYCDQILARYRVWTDPNRLRSKRKGVQLRGYVRIFEDTFTPAFRRRGWSEGVLRRERRKIALVHAAGCYAPQFSLEERTALKAILYELSGDNYFWLRLRLLALDIGLRPMFDVELAARESLKQKLKSLISMYRSARPIS